MINLLLHLLCTARNAFDLEGKVIGTIGAGRIGYRVLQRLKPFDPKELLYYDYAPLPEAAAQSIGARRVEDLKDFVSQCDIVTVNAPLHEGTVGLVNADLLKHFKKGAWLVNTARGAICDKDAVAEAVKSGQLRGYAGDVWNVQPAPKDHVWRWEFLLLISVQSYFFFAYMAIYSFLDKQDNEKPSRWW
jgi:formate dehydrogenase